MVDKSLQYTCLFGGGAIRGTAHVGVIKALEELGVEETALGGSSVGSIIAALRAVGYISEELAEIFLSVNFELFRDISLGFNTKFALSKGEVFLEWIRELIEKKYYGAKYVKGCNEPVKFKDLEKTLVIITTNLKDFTCCEFSNIVTPEFEIAMAVRISCCMPGLMRAVNYEDKLLVDGDLMKSKPMWLLSKTLCRLSDRVLEIRLEGNFSGDDKNPLSYVNGMYSCITASGTSFVGELYQNSDKYDCLKIDTGDVVVVDFNYPQDKRQAIIDGGYEQTMNYFKNVLQAKKRYLISVYQEISNQLRLVRQNLNRKKFVQAKFHLAEIFINICGMQNVIEPVILSEIKMLQKLLYSNVKTGLLGYSYCNNLQTVLGALNSLDNGVRVKISELNLYLEKFSV